MEIMSDKGANIIESIFSVLGKIIAVTIYTVTRFLEVILSGFNSFLKKKIDTKN
jgi:hypothetical protein